MKTKTAIVVVTLICAGCSSMYGDPAERQLRNKSISSYSLCERLALATLAPSAIREEWAKELESRDEDCSRYAGTIQNVIARKNQLNNNTNTNKSNYQLPQSVHTSCSQMGGFINCTSR